MKNYWKIVIVAFIVVIALVFTTVAHYADERAAFPLIMVVNLALLAGGIWFYVKYGMKEVKK